MTLDTFVVTVCAIGLVVCWVGYRYCQENVYIKSKYQRGRYVTAPTNKKGAKK